MVDVMSKIWLIAHNTFRETMRRKVLFLALLVFVLGLVQICLSLRLLQLANNAGEAQIAARLRVLFPSYFMYLWQQLGSILAIFLGAMGASHEIAAKTIVHVLSRPIGRTQYLIGRWLGLTIFLWLLEALGIGLALLVAEFFGVAHTPMLWLLCASFFVSTMLYSGLSLSLNTWLPSVPAGIGAFFVMQMAGSSYGAQNDPNQFVRLLAVGEYYLFPATMPVNLISSSFGSGMLSPDYGLYAQVLLENVFFAGVAFAIGCMVFSRRELPMR